MVPINNSHFGNEANSNLPQNSIGGSAPVANTGSSVSGTQPANPRTSEIQTTSTPAAQTENLNLNKEVLHAETGDRVNEENKQPVEKGSRESQAILDIMMEIGESEVDIKVLGDKLTEKGFNINYVEGENGKVEFLDANGNVTKAYKDTNGDGGIGMKDEDFAAEVANMSIAKEEKGKLQEMQKEAKGKSGGGKGKTTADKPKDKPKDKPTDKPTDKPAEPTTPTTTTTTEPPTPPTPATPEEPDQTTITVDVGITPATPGGTEQTTPTAATPTTPDATGQTPTAAAGTTPIAPGTTPTVPGTTPAVPGTAPAVPGTTPAVPGATGQTPTDAAGITPTAPGGTTALPPMSNTGIMPLPRPGLPTLNIPGITDSPFGGGADSTMNGLVIPQAGSFMQPQGFNPADLFRPPDLSSLTNNWSWD
jgi:hypothetical protein